MTSIPPTDRSNEIPGLAVVVGGTGGIGSALVAGLQAQGYEVLAIGRRTQPALDYTDEATVGACAQHVADHLAHTGLPLRRLLVATGFLHGDTPGGQRAEPERSWQPSMPPPCNTTS